MRQLVFAAMFAALPFAASAQEPTIVDACTRAAELVVSRGPVTASDAQSFPELSPPRVQLQAWGEGAADRISDVINRELGESDGPRPVDYGKFRCEFSSPTPPFGLTRLECGILGCVTSSRLEEIQMLLEREGF